MSGTFKDHFSGHADNYAAFRPGYPAQLFSWLAGVAPARDLAWDCATGNGQAARGLAAHFEKVIATDASREQIRHAGPAPNISYRVEPAEESSLDGGSAGLITVAQAYHWLNHKAFLREAGRVLSPGGVLAIWTYALARIGPGVDDAVQSYYHELVGPYWPPERRIVERGYRDFDFPWPELESPSLCIELDWDLPAFEAYLGTWSASQRFRMAEAADPVEQFHPRLAAAWGQGGGPRRVSWPLAIRAFRKD